MNSVAICWLVQRRDIVWHKFSSYTLIVAEILRKIMNSVAIC